MDSAKKEELKKWRIVVSRSNKSTPWIYLGKVKTSKWRDDHIKLTNCFNIGYYEKIGLVGVCSEGPDKVTVYGDGTVDREVMVLNLLDNLSVGDGWYDFLDEKRLLDA